jgi:hypothetical protein
MSTQIQASLANQVEEAARIAGLTVTGSEAGVSFTGTPTTKFTLTGPKQRTLTLEFSDSFEFGRREIAEELKTYFAETAKRLKNPDPDIYMTAGGMPIRFGKFVWPFHQSTSGADTLLVHGEIKLEDGYDSPLHAKVAAAMTLTFAEIVPALEQPFAEGFIYNAVRKTLDQGQLELVKSGNRQPVPVTTRYYSRWQKKFNFHDSDQKQREDFLAAKVYWLSGVLGGGAPVWVMDPRDAQYLNTTVLELKRTAQALARDGVLLLQEEEGYAGATEALMGHKDEYEAELAAALQFIKPTFNEEMRHGHTNM